MEETDQVQARLADEIKSAKSSLNGMKHSMDCTISQMQYRLKCLEEKFQKVYGKKSDG